MAAKTPEKLVKSLMDPELTKSSGSFLCPFLGG